MSGFEDGDEVYGRVRVVGLVLLSSLYYRVEVRDDDWAANAK